MSEKDEPRKSPDYFINTAPEMDALERAAADGKHGRHYTSDSDYGVVKHVIPGASHHVRLDAYDSETGNLTTEALEHLAQQQDADSALAFLYIARQMAPPFAASDIDVGRGTIDFDDVITKIGWDPRSTAERREMHQKLYQFIKFGERAQVVGKRRGAYKDKHTGDLIDTEISAAMWRVVETEKPEQGSMFPSYEVPVRVELVMSSTWVKLLTSPQTTQYLPMGEILGAIPGNKPSGAWARVIGLALASFWRRNPRESLDGTLHPTRRELLNRYPPKTGTAEDVNNSTKPMRALEYWCGALAILVDQGLLEKSGEAAVTIQQQKARLPRQGWFDEWMNETVDLRPGDLLRESIVRRGIALPPVSTPRKRGRPKKEK